MMFFFPSAADDDSGKAAVHLACLSLPLITSLWLFPKTVVSNALDYSPRIYRKNKLNFRSHFCNNDVPLQYGQVHGNMM